MQLMAKEATVEHKLHNAYASRCRDEKRTDALLANKGERVSPICAGDHLMNREKE